MVKIPDTVAEFLRGRRMAVAGVSRHPSQAANAVFRKLRDSRYEVFPKPGSEIGNRSTIAALHNVQTET